MRKYLVRTLFGSGFTIFVFPALYDASKAFFDISASVDNPQGAAMTALSAYLSLSHHWWYPWAVGSIVGYFGGELIEWFVHRRKSAIERDIEALRSLSDEIRELFTAIADDFSNPQGYVDIKKIQQSNPALRSRIMSMIAALSALKISTPEYLDCDPVEQNLGYHLYLRDIWPFVQKGQIYEARRFADAEISSYKNEILRSRQIVLGEV